MEVEANSTAGAPEMTSLVIDSHILYRYAKTTVTSQLVNNADVARELSFNVVLPQSAFISKFHIELNGVIYDAYVKEKEEAKQEYNNAVSQGWTAAKVETSVRDANRFSVSVNVEARVHVTFKLTYEELLGRRLGSYNHVVNIDPGQIVPELRVRVRIEESHTLTSLRVPTLKISNEVDTLPDVSAGDDPHVQLERPSDNVAVVTWCPTPEQQRLLRHDGVQGQLSVKYDVERQGNASQILMSEGHFVHFYAPVDLEPLKKHVVFVLDVSPSMGGSKIQQLKEAMMTVLTDLRDGDFFTIVTFSYIVHAWLPPEMQSVLINVVQETPLQPGFIVAVTPENIRLAKEFVNNLHLTGGTNIYDALMIGLEMVNLGRSTFNASHIANAPEPMVIFLTDGQANIGESNHDVIVKDVTKRNMKRAAIFSLCFGHDADKDFLKKLSLSNAAFSRVIYEGSDAALQLEDFYRQVSSPLLANVAFFYEPEHVTVDTLTTQHFPNLFLGDELVVAGKMAADSDHVCGELKAKALCGQTSFCFPKPLVINQSPGFMERLWAYLNIQQLMDRLKTEEGEEEKTSKDKALQLALKYSFVTPLTSLVVVKPNETSRADAVDASGPQMPQPMAPQPMAPQPMAPQTFAPHTFAPPPAMYSRMMAPTYHPTSPSYQPMAGEMAAQMNAMPPMAMMKRMMCRDSAPVALMDSPSSDSVNVAECRKMAPQSAPMRGGQCDQSLQEPSFAPPPPPARCERALSKGSQLQVADDDCKKERNDSTSEVERKYPKIKVSATSDAQNYAVKMAALLFLRGLNSGHDFELAVNVAGAGAFQDIVFKFLTADNVMHTVFLKLKHATGEKFSMDSLTRVDGELSLLKYFDSFMELKKLRGNGSLFNGGVDTWHFTVITNGDFQRGESGVDVRTSPVDEFVSAGSGLAVNFGDTVYSELAKQKQEKFPVGSHAVEVKDFLRSLKLFTGQSTVGGLDDIIKGELRKRGGEDVDGVFPGFLGRIREWWEQSDGVILDRNSLFL